MHMPVLQYLFLRTFSMLNMFLNVLNIVTFCVSNLLVYTFVCVPYFRFVRTIFPGTLWLLHLFSRVDLFSRFR